ncbi:MAG: imidazole glycerol phosphate synthase subunit HisH [Candidatus Omnitrophota bacterium]
MNKEQAPLVAIIDYRLGNLFSVQQACVQVGLRSVITSEKKNILEADAIILPGVGAFKDGIESLEKLDLITPIHSAIKSGKPFMGICLGMQLLFSKSEEFGNWDGLDVISGSVVKFPSENAKGIKTRVPQVGWNRLSNNRDQDRWNESPLKGISENEFMYFVHSYYCKPDNSSVVLSVTQYADMEYCSSILIKNVFACQFHPEKSGEQGLTVYKNWAEYIQKMKGI